jgi:hypothetical protein
MLQVPVSLYLDSSAQLSPTAIQLFLHIAKMVLTTGQTNHTVLAHILSMLLALIPASQQAWPTMPSTLEGFQSHILNPTNKNAVVTLLPVPKAYMLHDGCHAYCCLQEVAAFVLLLPRTRVVTPVPLRLEQLCCSANLLQCLRQPIATSCRVTLGLLFWLDGWDPSASSKNNRSPVHTASATLLCIDSDTGGTFDDRTFPVACGPGKAGHNIIFRAMQISLDKLAAQNTLLWSHHHGGWTTICHHLIAFLMDQPERRGSNHLLGGNSKQHAMFGMSCNFEELERKFAACSNCLRIAVQYVEAADFSTPLVFACHQCYSFSLPRLVKYSKYKAPIHPRLPVDAPGHTLTTHPGTLHSKMKPGCW